MPEATSPTDRTNVGRKHFNVIENVRHPQEAKTWKDLAQAAYKKQLAPREKPSDK